jgi:hypothetical protein
VKLFLVRDLKITLIKMREFYSTQQSKCETVLVRDLKISLIEMREFYSTQQSKCETVFSARSENHSDRNERVLLHATE